MAKHFCHYLNLLNIKFIQWSRANNNLSELSNYLNKTSHVLLLISDDTIDQFIKENKLDSSGKYLLHFSGSLQSEHADSAHPLMTFNHSYYTLDEYKEIPFCFTSNKYQFTQLLPNIPNRSFYLSIEKKHYYHAMCVVSNNFTTILWQKFINEMKEMLGMDDIHIFPILEKTFQNIRNDYRTALTGPIVRNDHKTIQNNIKSLRETPLEKIYEEMITLNQENNSD